MGIFRIIRHLFRRKKSYLNQPPSKLTEYSLPDLDNSWLCCGDFSDVAKNHCHAVCVCNLIHFLFPECVISFEEVHNIIGNGPVFTLRKLKKLCRHSSLSIRCNKLYTEEDVKTSLSSGEPCIILVANHLCDWHWILAVGFAESDEETLLRIVDGWHTDCDRWYPVRKNHGWLAAYSMKKT